MRIIFHCPCLVAADMWFCRRMLKISWELKVANQEVKARIGKPLNIMKTIAKRQVRFFGHVVRKEKIEQLAVTGKIEGKKSRGRQRIKFMDQIKEFTNTGTISGVFHKLRERELAADVF